MTHMLSGSSSVELQKRMKERMKVGVEKNGFRFFEGDEVKVYIKGNLTYKDAYILILPILSNDWTFIINEYKIVQIHESENLKITKNILYYEKE